MSEINRFNFDEVDDENEPRRLPTFARSFSVPNVVSTPPPPPPPLPSLTSSITSLPKTGTRIPQKITPKEKIKTDEKAKFPISRDDICKQRERLKRADDVGNVTQTTRRRESDDLTSVLRRVIEKRREELCLDDVTTTSRSQSRSSSRVSTSLHCRQTWNTESDLFNI